MFCMISHFLENCLMMRVLWGCCDVVSVEASALKMEVVCFSENVVPTYKLTQHPQPRKPPFTSSLL